MFSRFTFGQSTFDGMFDMVSVCGGVGHICYEGEDELKIDDYHGPSVDNEQFDISALVSYYLDGGDSESEDWSKNLVYNDFESVDGGFSSRSVVCSNEHLGTVGTESLVYEKITEFDKDIIGIDHIKNDKDEEELDVEALVSFYLDRDGPGYREFECSLLYDDLWENQTNDFRIYYVGDEDIRMENFSNGDCDFTFDNEVANTAAQLMPVACGGSDLGPLLERNGIRRCLVINDNDVLILDSCNVPDLVKVDTESLVSFNFDGDSMVDVLQTSFFGDGFSLCCGGCDENLDTRRSVNLMAGGQLRFKLLNGYG